MIIDCHGHYTTEPKGLKSYREQQVAAVNEKKPLPSWSQFKVTDDEIRETIEGNQLKKQQERGTNITIFSPRAAGMGHHIGDFKTSLEWSQASNEMIYRVTELFPDNFIGVCQLPQSPGVEPKTVIPELERCIKEYGFVGCNLNPDPSGGHWNAPPLTDRYWYPVYEKLCELDCPAMVHVSMSCNPAFHTTGAHYINADTTAFMQLITSDLFADFPKLRLIIPHGGGAVPFHWGRYRGLALQNKKNADRGDDPQQRVLRHLRLPSAGHRAPHQDRADRQHPVRVGDDRRGADHRSQHRALLRRHQALRRPGIVAHRGR